eukprot:TRINITY_DN5263_c0_g2_i1.p1 TRINITY_DN5263_c0_g2~~TRINITY_DN5263_c0_g2_i1.p1  ORF type:complete len:199 (+),score=-9.98 TRINITY_DN5263_c0_g2_i1:384-980(+)
MWKKSQNLQLQQKLSNILRMSIPISFLNMQKYKNGCNIIFSWKIFNLTSEKQTLEHYKSQFLDQWLHMQYFTCIANYYIIIQKYKNFTKLQTKNIKIRGKQYWLQVYSIRNTKSLDNCKVYLKFGYGFVNKNTAIFLYQKYPDKHKKYVSTRTILQSIFTIHFVHTIQRTILTTSQKAQLFKNLKNKILRKNNCKTEQ